MSELIDRLRERADFEDRHVRERAERDGFVVEHYTGSRTGALLREAADALAHFTAAHQEEPRG